MSQTRSSFDAYACFTASAIACAFNGVTYAFPMLTPKLYDSGLGSSDVVFVGVMMQLGYGIISYPFARFYMSNFRNMRPSAKDRFVNIITTAAVILALGMLIFAANYTEKTGVVVPTAVICICYLIWSSSLAVTYYQCLSILNYMFASDKALRRKAVAIMTFATGLGSGIFVIIFYYGLSKLSLLNNYVAILGIYVPTAVLRIKYMRRDRYDDIPTLELPEINMPSVTAGPVVLPSPGRSGAAQANLTDLVDDYESQRQASSELGDLALVDNPVGGAEANSTIAHEDLETVDSETEYATAPSQVQQAPVLAERRPTRQEYIKSPVVWLTTVSAFFAYGIGSIFLNSLGNLATDLVESELAADKVTFNLTMTFLTMVIVARIVVTVLYAHFNWPHINTIWNVMLFFGLIIYVAYPTLAGAYLSSAFVGFGFGGIVSCMAVIATASFPGGVADNSVNLAIAYSVTSPGPFLLGLIQTAIYEKSPLTNFDSTEIKSISTYIFFLSVTFFSLACSVALGLQLKKHNRLELQNLFP